MFYSICIKKNPTSLSLKKVYDILMYNVKNVDPYLTIILRIHIVHCDDYCFCLFPLPAKQP